MSNIQGKVLIVRPSISMPGNSRTDEVLTSEVHDNHNMKAEAGRYVKSLYPKFATDPLTKISGAARKRHKELTLSTGFGDLTPTALYTAWADTMQEYIDKFNDAADTFSEPENYAAVLAEARRIHGNAFDPNDYPPQYKIRGEFSFTLFSAPMPRAADVVVSHLTQHQIAAVREQLETEAQRAQAEATKQMTQRILERVQKITDRLASPDHVFRDTLIENLEGLLKIAPAMNIGDDPTLTKLIQECTAKLLVAPETLRVSKGARQAAFLHAKTIVGRYGIGGRKIDNGASSTGSASSLGESGAKKAA